MSDEQDIIAQWARLGVLWAARPSRRPPDLESLIVRSAPIAAADPRLLVLMASWIFQYWRCVGRDRLRQAALGGDVRTQATVGLLFETVDSWLPASVFGTVLRDLARVPTPEPLLVRDSESQGLRRLVEAEASDISRRWGFWALPIGRRSNVVRSTDWVWRMNPGMRERSLFKGSLKTSLLACIEAAGGRALSPTQLAQQCGVTRKAVYEAMEDLRFSAGRTTGSRKYQAVTMARIPAARYAPPPPGRIKPSRCERT